MTTFWAAFVGGISGSVTTSLLAWLRARDAKRKAARREW